MHAQTEAVYRLLAELRARHPRLEIESCSSGGARIDYGILGHTDRVWTSDTNDALERQAIQRWTGLEWDLTTCDSAELAELAAWVTLHKRLRPLLHTGDVVRADHPDPAIWLHGVVATDRGQAVFAYVNLTSSVDHVPAALRFPGLDPQAGYELRVITQLLPAALRRDTGRQPAWLRNGTITAPGAVLTGTGLAAPVLQPGTALVVELTRVSR